MWPQDPSTAGPSSIVPPSRPRNQHTDDAATCLVRKPDGFTFTHEQLNQLFADFKPIHDIREVRAGFFVVLDSPEVAQQAINKLHNRQLGPGWLMRVERAKVREWPLAPAGATQRVAPEAPGPFPSFGGALSSNNPNLSPIGTRKPASEVVNEAPRVPGAVQLDSPRQMPSSSLFIQGLPLSASWQSLKDWSLTGHPECRMMKPFVDVWCQGAQIEGRLGFRTPDIAAAAKQALERWPYEGRNLTITYHSQIQKLLHKEPIETREYAAQDEPRDFDVPRKRPRSPEPPYGEETEEDPQLLLDLEFARQRGHHLRKEDLVLAPRPADDAPLPAKKAKSEARAAPPKTTAEEDKLAEALRILKEMEQAAKPAASYDWGTGKVVYGAASPEKVDAAAPSSKTNTPALTFDDTASSFASPAKYEVGSMRGGRESRPSAAAWTYDEDAVVHRKFNDVPDVLPDPFEARLFPQAQGRRDAGWGSKASEPRVSPPEVRVVDKGKEMGLEMDSARNGYLAASPSDYAAPSQSDLFAQQHEGKKRAGFPVDMSRGFPQDEMRGFPDFSRRVPCRYFPNCRRGDSCAFLHNAEPEPALPFRDPAFMRQADQAWGAYDERRDDANYGWGAAVAAETRNGDESGWHKRKEGERRSSRETEGSRWHKDDAAAAASSSAAGWGESTPPPRVEPARASPPAPAPAPAPARTEEEKRSDERREARRAERLQRQAGLLPPSAGRSSSATVEQVCQPPATAATSQAPAATDAAVSQPPTAAATTATTASPTASKSQEAPAQPDTAPATLPLPKLKFKLKLKESSQVEPSKAVQPLAETQQQQPKPLEEAPVVPDKNDKAKSEVTAAPPEPEEDKDKDDQLCQIDKVCMAATKKKEEDEIEVQKVKVAPAVGGGKEESPWAY